MQRNLMKVTDFTVELVQRNAVVGFIEKHHYSHNINGVQSYYHFGLYREGKFGLPEMIGAMLYAMPSMPSTAKKYNPINPTKCFELRRLVCIDDTPKNTESYFIGQTFKWLKKNKIKDLENYSLRLKKSLTKLMCVMHNYITQTALWLATP